MILRVYSPKSFELPCIPDGPGIRPLRPATNPHFETASSLFRKLVANNLPCNPSKAPGKDGGLD